MSKWQSLSRVLTGLVTGDGVSSSLICACGRDCSGKPTVCDALQNLRQKSDQRKLLLAD